MCGIHLQYQLFVFQFVIGIQRRPSPIYFSNVYILAYYDVVGDPNTDAVSIELILLGTAFPVTRRHVITTFHNIVEENDSLLVGSFVIGKIVEKQNGNLVMIEPITVTYAFGDTTEDFAFLEIENAEIVFNSYLPLCPVDRLPDRNVKESIEVKTYHAPIGLFQHTQLATLQIWADDYKRIQQYDRGDTRVIVEGGLYRGSCGGPYVDHDGLVVAMHVASMNEGENISLVKSKVGKKRKKPTMDDLQSLRSSVNDLHASVREGVVLSRIRAVVDFISAVNSNAAPPVNG